MKRTKFSEMLESERIRLGHSQTEIAEWLYMTQSTYSRMESGRINPGIERSLEVINILEAHGYVGVPAIELQDMIDHMTVTVRWPFHRYWFYALSVVLVLMAIQYIVGGPEDFARGFSDGYAGKEAAGSALQGMIYLLLLSGILIFGIYRMFRKWLR